MTRRIDRRLLAIVPLLVALVSAGCRQTTSGESSAPSTGSAAPAATAATVGAPTRIAVNIPLSGPVASFSGEWVNGLTLGIDDASGELGVARQAFVIDAQDNQAQPSLAATIAQKQVSEGFQVYASGVSQMSKAVAPSVDNTGAVHFLVSYDAHLTEGAQNRMRILPHFKAEGPVYAEYAKTRGATRVVSFTLNNPEIQGQFTEYVEPALEAQGIAFRREVYEFPQSDFRTQALRAKGFKPDLVLVSGFSVHVLPILRALRAQGLIGDGNVLCIMDFNELLGGSVSAKELAGVAYIAPPFEFPENRPARDAWSAKYQQRFGKRPNFIPAFGYDTGRLIVAARKAKTVVNKEAIRAMLPYKGLAGEITVDAAGDLSTPLGILKVRPDGSVERIR
jgi:branched-chain amino acid transport system substrate-binding protein